MKNILIVDHTEYRAELKELLSGYRLEFCSTAFDAISQINSKGYDLVISEVDLPGGNSFELYYYLSKHLPYMPVIMLSTKSIDDQFEEIFKNGIGNVLQKPLKEYELLNLVSKLTGQTPVFGLKYYLKGMTEQKKIRINSSAQINTAITKLTQIVQSWGFKIENLMMINLILNELIINAVYHAHGFTNKKLKREKLILPNNKFVEIFFGRSKDEYAISITDYMGSLTSKRILESIYAVINQKKVMEEAILKGDVDSLNISESGRGIELVRKLAKEFYFIIQNGLRTDSILLFDSEHAFDSTPSSLKIIERQ